MRSPVTTPSLFFKFISLPKEKDIKKSSPLRISIKIGWISIKIARKKRGGEGGGLHHFYSENDRNADKRTGDLKSGPRIIE